MTVHIYYVCNKEIIIVSDTAKHMSEYWYSELKDTSNLNVIQKWIESPPEGKGKGKGWPVQNTVLHSGSNSKAADHVMMEKYCWIYVQQFCKCTELLTFWYIKQPYLRQVFLTTHGVVYNFCRLYVCQSDDNLWKSWCRKFIFAHLIYLQGIQVRFIY